MAVAWSIACASQRALGESGRRLIAWPSLWKAAVAATKRRRKQAEPEAPERETDRERDADQRAATTRSEAELAALAAQPVHIFAVVNGQLTCSSSSAASIVHARRLQTVHSKRPIVCVASSNRRGDASSSATTTTTMTATMMASDNNERRHDKSHERYWAGHNVDCVLLVAHSPRRRRRTRADVRQAERAARLTRSSALRAAP